MQPYSYRIENVTSLAGAIGFPLLHCEWLRRKKEGKKSPSFGSRFRSHRCLEWHLHSSVTEILFCRRLKRNSGAVLWWAYLLYIQIPLSRPSVRVLKSGIFRHFFLPPSNPTLPPKQFSLKLKEFSPLCSLTLTKEAGNKINARITRIPNRRHWIPTGYVS